MKNLFAVGLVAMSFACAKTPATPQQVPLSQLPAVDSAAILAHTKVLSSDEYEGRGPGTKGEGLTVRYLVDQFTMLGLKPGNTDGTYIQKVPLVGITAAPAPLVLQKGSRRLTLKWKDDVVAWTKHVADSASLDRSELVFVGYGVVAPEYHWDDYKGLDVKGKTLVMLLGVTASMTIRNSLRTIDSQNVVAKLEGSDPALKDEYVIYTAHWDHLGIGRSRTSTWTA